MRKPNIVFCPHNHIYDASIYSECPYCKKIEEQQQDLEKEIDQNRSAEDNEKTELIYTDQDGEEDEKTELLYSKDEEDEKTELLSDGEDTAEENENINKYTLANANRDAQPELETYQKAGLKEDAESKGKVLRGWLVCISRGGANHSFEISTDSERLCIRNGELCVPDSLMLGDKTIAEIRSDGRSCVIEPLEGIRFTLNNRSCKRAVLRNYDVITIDDKKYAFIEFNAMLFNG